MPPLALLSRLRDWLADPRLAAVDVDSDERLRVHAEILAESGLTRDVFRELYTLCRSADDRCFTGPGHRVEIGAGVSFFKKTYPDIVSSDVVAGGDIDLVLDAQRLPFRAATLRSVYGIHCFHHIPDPSRFFDELIRVLRPGGGCVLIEPYHGWVAARFFERLFDSETFDKTQTEWSAAGAGVMTGANQALSYIVFTRDLAVFRVRYPELEIVEQWPMRNYVRYLLSGGMNFRSLAPALAAGPLRALEWLLNPFRRVLALHHVIVIRRRPSATV